MRRRMALVWGVTSRSILDIKKIDGLAMIAEKRLMEERLVRKGDVIGIVAGTPMGIRGTTNFMKFHVIGSLGKEGSDSFGHTRIQTHHPRIQDADILFVEILR